MWKITEGIKSDESTLTHFIAKRFLLFLNSGQVERQLHTLRISIPQARNAVNVLILTSDFASNRDFISYEMTA